MTSFWNILRDEVKATVDDFRDKGAVGAFRDAALDTRDLAAAGGGWLWNGVKSVVADESEPVLYVVGVPARGDMAPLHFPDGTVVEATVLEVDGVSEPPRARVAVPSTGLQYTVNVLDPNAVPHAAPEEQGAGENQGSLLGDLRNEWHATVQDFREKGVVGAVRDSALDAVDLVGNFGGTAVSGARSFAAPLLQSQAARGESEEGAVVATGNEPSLLDGLRQEWKDTMQDFREKGAVGAFRDATLDAVDMVNYVAAPAAKKVQDMAAPAVTAVSESWAPAVSAVSGMAAPAATALQGHAAMAFDGAWSVAGSIGASVAALQQDSEGTASVDLVALQEAEPAATATAAPAAAVTTAAPAAAEVASAASAASGGYARAATVEPAATPTVAAAPQSFLPKPTPALVVAAPSNGDAQAVAGSASSGGAGRKSLVSMRRNMFEKPKEETKKDEELID